MQALGQLYSSLKKGKEIAAFLQFVQGVSQKCSEMAPEEFAKSDYHKQVCEHMHELDLTAIKKAFAQIPELPTISAIILQSNSLFTMAFLMIPKDTKFQWHDHEGMNGISKVVGGKLKIRSMNPALFEPVEDKPDTFQYGCQQIRTQIIKESTDNKISLIFPDSYNIHQIEAMGQQSAFLDLLIPEYPDNQCFYFRERASQEDGKLEIQKTTEPEHEVIGLETLAKIFKTRTTSKINSTQ